MNKQVTLSHLLNQTTSELSDNRQIVGTFLAVMISASFVANFVAGGGTSSALGFGFSYWYEDIAGAGALSAVIALFVFVLNIVMNYWLVAGLLKRSISPGFERFLPWIGIYILATLAIVFGLALLIVPGIILAVRWVAILPLVIRGEVPAMDVFGASWDMTRGHSWSIFGGFVILFILLLFVNAIAGGVAVASGSFIGSAVAAIADTVSNVLFTAFSVGAYRLLKDDTQGLAEVFE